MKLSKQLLSKLEEEYGDSFYVLDIRRFENNYQEFLSAFRSIYLNSNIAYSYKTNYTPKLCQCVNSMGGYAEVVSQMEYELAIRLGVPPEKVIFNGPLKSYQDIENALLGGSIVNLDSPYEIEIVKTLSQKYSTRNIAVGIRCNFDIGTGTISRFGFDVEGGGLTSVFTTLDHLKNCQIVGLHCHFSTLRSAESYALRTKKMLDLSRLYFRNQPPQFIDLGGGFFGKMGKNLKEQFNCPVPNYREYAEAIAPQFADAFPRNPTPELILEPGIGLLGNIMRFVARVVDVKIVRSRKLAVSTGSIYNIKPTMNDKNLPMQVYSDSKNPERKRMAGPIDIVGYTCMERDCLYKGYEGSIAAGDYLVFDNVGAYTTVLKPPFIRPSPAIIAYDSDLDKYELIKRQERYEEVFSTYVT